MKGLRRFRKAPPHRSRTKIGADSDTIGELDLGTMSDTIEKDQLISPPLGPLLEECGDRRNRGRMTRMAGRRDGGLATHRF